MRRVGYAILVAIALIIVIWLTLFVVRIFHRAVEQRELPADARARLAQTA